MWAGRFSKSLSQITNEFNSSIKIDKVMFAEDIKGSIDIPPNKLKNVVLIPKYNNIVFSI